MPKLSFYTRERAESSDEHHRYLARAFVVCGSCVWVWGAAVATYADEILVVHLESDTFAVGVLEREGHGLAPPRIQVALISTNQTIDQSINQWINRLLVP